MKIIKKLLIISLIVLTLVLAGCGNDNKEEDLSAEDFISNVSIYKELGGKNAKLVDERPGSCELCKEYEYVFDPSEESGFTGDVRVIVFTENGVAVDSKIYDNTRPLTDQEIKEKTQEELEMDYYEKVEESILLDSEYVYNEGINLKFIRKGLMECKNCYEFTFSYEALEYDEEKDTESYVEHELIYAYKNGLIEHVTG